MAYRKATYEEYCKASQFAKLRYKYGVYIQFVAAALLLFLVYYTVTNVEEMKANPKDYAESHLDVICMSPVGIYEVSDQTLTYNGSSRNISGVK